MKKNRRVVHAARFFCSKVLVPFLFIFGLADIIATYVSEKTFFSVVEVIPAFGDHWKDALDQVPWAYVPILLIILFVVYRQVILKLFGYTKLFSDNHYYLVPSWMIRVASLINGQYLGSATSIPIWQFCEYLYHKSDIGWRKLTLEVPNVQQADDDVRIRVESFDLNKAQTDSTTLSVVVSDTYPIDTRYLPNEIKDHAYDVFSTLKNGHADRIRRYNPELVSMIVARVTRAESEGIKSLNLILNTNPRVITEVFREAFLDAGRNSIEHLYVYESQADTPFHFVKAHLIF